MITDLARPRVLQQRVEHALVVAQRRVDVDDRVDARGSRVQRLGAAERCGRARGSRAPRSREIPARRSGLSVSVISESCMSRWRESSGQVVRLARQAAGGVEVVVDLGERQKSAEVGERRLAPHAALAHERRALDGAELHGVAADDEAALGVAAVQRERRRRQGDLLEHEVRVEPHDSCLTFWPAASRKARSASGWWNSMPSSVHAGAASRDRCAPARPRTAPRSAPCG